MSQSEIKLAQSVAVGTLCAFYGGLLTDRQREALRLHFVEDCSLGEIAEEFGVTRQNIHELINRSVQKLARYEQTLHLVEQAEETRKAIGEALSRLERAQIKPETAADEIAATIQILRNQRSDDYGEETVEHGI